jgi:hypothetical protein
MEKYLNTVKYPYQFSFSMGGINIVINSQAIDVIEELRQYIPLDRIIVESLCAYSIYVIEDIELEDEIRHGTVELSKVNVKPEIMYSKRVHEGCDAFISDVGFEGHEHVVLKKGESVLVVLRNTDEQSIRMPLRVVREVLLREFENNGASLFHAAMVELWEGSGALIVGDKAAGKTTTMMHLLVGGAAYVSNDMTIVKGDQNGGMLGYGWPLSVRVGMGLVDSLIGLKSFSKKEFSRIQDKQIWKQSFSTEREKASNWGVQSKLELTPTEVSSITNADIACCTEVACLVFPRLDISANEIKIELVEPEAVLDCLSRNSREPVDEDYLTGWMGVRRLNEGELAENANNITSKLLALPIFIISGNPSYFEENMTNILDKIKSEVVNR